MSEKSLEESDEYLWFKANVELRTVVFNMVKKDLPGNYTPQIWEYYLYTQRPNEKSVVLVMFPSMLEKGDSFHYIFHHLEKRKKITKSPVTIVAIDDFPPLHTHEDFMKSFHSFISILLKKKEWEIHLCGSEYSGFLVQLFAQTYPQHVKSLILVNTYCNSEHFRKEYSYVDYYHVVPSFILRRFLTGLFPTKTTDENNRKSIEFVLKRFSSLDSKVLASRYKLKGIFAKIFQISVRVDDITIIETCDEDWLVEESLKDSLYKFYPEARRAFMKKGGEFPYLSQPQDFVLFIEVHLNRYTANELFVVAEKERVEIDDKKNIGLFEDEFENIESEEEGEEEGEIDDDENIVVEEIEESEIQEGLEEAEEIQNNERVFEGGASPNSPETPVFGRVEEIKSNTISPSESPNGSPSDSPYQSDGSLSYFEDSGEMYGSL